jgi:hypothetical protein
MTLRTHLVDSHIALAKCFAAACGHHRTASEALTDGPEKACHDAMAKTFSDQADHHMKCAQACASMDMNDGVPVGDTHGPSKVLSHAERFGKVADDGVAGTVPDNPNVRLVTRAGSPSVEEIEKANGTAAIPEKHRQVFERRTAGE